MDWKELNKCVINLPERPERLAAFKKELVYLPCSNLTVMNGVNHSVSLKGIGQAHLNCVLLAKQNEWPYVLIMEDDCVFQGKEQTYDYLLNCLSNLPENWDILLGGLYFSKLLTPVNEFWNQTGEFCGTHFYIVNSNCYDEILKYDFSQHIDRWMNWQGKGLKCFVTKKFIATQRDGWSDNVKAKVNYSSKLKNFKLL